MLGAQLPANERDWRRQIKSGIALTSKLEEGIEFLNNNEYSKIVKSLFLIWKRNFWRAPHSSSRPRTYSSQADGQSINYLNAHRDVRSSGQHFNEKQRVARLLTGPLCFWLALLQQHRYIYGSGCG